MSLSMQTEHLMFIQFLFVTRPSNILIIQYLNLLLTLLQLPIGRKSNVSMYMIRSIIDCHGWKWIPRYLKIDEQWHWNYDCWKKKEMIGVLSWEKCKCTVQFLIRFTATIYCCHRLCIKQKRVKLMESILSMEALL